MVGDGLSEVFDLMFKGIIFFILVAIATSVYSIYVTFWKEPSLESRVPLQPEIRLETDGKKIDTIYVYKLKNDGS